jgi:hypothetical protein
MVYVSPIAACHHLALRAIPSVRRCTQHYTAIKSDSYIKKLEECTLAVRNWFTGNGLLNPDKSDALLVAWRSNAAKFASVSGIIVAGSLFRYCVQMKSLGVTLDQKLLTFDQHVSIFIKSSNFNICAPKTNH